MFSPKDESEKSLRGALLKLGPGPFESNEKFADFVIAVKKTKDVWNRSVDEYGFISYAIDENLERTTKLLESPSSPYTQEKGRRHDDAEDMLKAGANAVDEMRKMYRRRGIRLPRRLGKLLEKAKIVFKS